MLVHERCGVDLEDVVVAHDVRVRVLAAVRTELVCVAHRRAQVGPRPRLRGAAPSEAVQHRLRQQAGGERNAAVAERVSVDLQAEQRKGEEQEEDEEEDVAQRHRRRQHGVHHHAQAGDVAGGLQRADEAQRADVGEVLHGRDEVEEGEQDDDAVQDVPGGAQVRGGSGVQEAACDDLDEQLEREGGGEEGVDAVERGVEVIEVVVGAQRAT